jgi:hypothetical protein
MRTVKSGYEKLQGFYESSPPINEFGTDCTKVIAYCPETHTYDSCFKIKVFPCLVHAPYPNSIFAPNRVT